jgi:hypothetical protein
MEGRLSKVSFTCAGAGAAPTHNMMTVADAHMNPTRGGQLFIDRSRP